MNTQRIVVVAAGILTLTVIPPSHAAGAARPASLVGTGTPDPGQDCRQVPITGIAAQGRAVFGLGLAF